MALKGTEKVTFEGMNPSAVMARDCRTLRSIDGVSERLRLTECGKNQLHLGGCWHSIELVSCRVERRRLLTAVPKFDTATQMACVKYLLTQYRYARMSAKERHQLVQQLLKSIPRVTRRVAMHLANRNPDYQVQYMSVALGAVIPDKKRQA